MQIDFQDIRSISFKPFLVSIVKHLERRDRTVNRKEASGLRFVRF